MALRLPIRTVGPRVGGPGAAAAPGRTSRQWWGDGPTSQVTAGFHAAKVPEGLCFQIHACRS